MSSFSRRDLATLRESLSIFHTEIGQFIQGYGSMPASESRAAREQIESLRPESTLSAWTVGTHLIEFAGEHLTAFVKTITEPVEVIACWTCVRSMLESCAISAWLLDPNIDARTRIGRVFAYRYEGLVQQVKFGKASGQPLDEIEALERRIDDVEQQAVHLGFARVLDRSSRRIGIAQRMPGATELIQTMLGDTAPYRLLSAVAHGHSWAIIQLGYKSTGKEVNVGGILSTAFEKTDALLGIAYLAGLVVEAISRPVRNQCLYFGWDEVRFRELFESASSRLQAIGTL